MSKKIFIHLPVADLQKSIAFYSAVGFANTADITDETAACMVVTEIIYLMLMTLSKFSDLTQKAVSNTGITAAVFNGLSVNSSSEVDYMIAQATGAGGKEHHAPKDYGFMQQRTFEDLDGHLWEVMHVDVSQISTQSYLNNQSI